MKGRTYIIRANGTAKVQDHKKMPSLDFFQEAVGGYIETIPAWPDPAAVAFCNEEGKLQGLPYNVTANGLWGNPHDALYGDIIVVTGDEAFMAKL